MTMNSKHLRIIVLTASALATAGCATGSGTDFMGDESWGEANRRTMAAQVVDPNPVYETAIPPTTAVNAVTAIEHYRDGTVEEPERVSTTEEPD